MRNAVIRTILSGLTASLVVTAGASATTTFPRDRICPVGGEAYRSFEIASTSSFGMRLDLQVVGPKAHLPYVECPNGFIVLKDESEYTADEIAKLTPVVASAEFQAARTAEVPAMRAILQERALGKSDTDLRHWYFTAASEAEYFQQGQLHQKYLAKAAEAFDAYLRTRSEHDEEWWASSIRRADILRQLGRFEEAVAAVKDLQAAHGSENPIFLKVAAQIAKRAQTQDSKPARYEDEGG